MTTIADIATARDKVIAQLTALADEAGRLDADPYWHSGLSTPQRWRQRGFHSALGILAHDPPTPSDSQQTYFARIDARVRDLRGEGPDLDDEGWYDTAIDEACSVLARALRE
jgi:hypothetical protein